MKKKLLEYYLAYQLYIWPIFAGISCILLSLVVIMPQASKIMEQIQTLTKTSQSISKLDSKLKELDSFNEADVKSNVSITLNILPSEKDLISAISQIQFLSSNNNVRVDNITFGSGSTLAQGANSGGFLVKINLSGTVPQIKQFLTSVKAAPRIMKPSSIELSGTRLGSNFQTNLGLVTFFEALPTSIGSIAETVPSLTNEELSLLNRIKESIKKTPIVTLENVSGTQGKIDPFQ